MGFGEVSFILVGFRTRMSGSRALVIVACLRAAYEALHSIEHEEQ